MKNILYGSISLFFIVLTVCLIVFTNHLTKPVIKYEHNGLKIEERSDNIKYAPTKYWKIVRDLYDQKSEQNIY